MSNIKTFKEFINESIWGDIRKRSTGEVIRQEDGKKVQTCIGIDVVLKNPTCPYDVLINDLIEKNSPYHSEYGVSIVNLRDMNLSPDEKSIILKGGAPYDYLIYEGGHGINLVADFWSHHDILDFELDDDFEENYIEDDYISICECVSKLLKTVGDSLEYVPRNKAYIIGGSNNSRSCDEYEGDYMLLLVNESTVSYFAAENEDVTLDDFKEDIIDNFPELKNVDFIGWTFYDGCNIAIPYTSISNLLNFKKYKEFTQNWFKI